MFYRVISAKDNEERRKHITKELKKIDLEPVFFDAIMGKDLSDEEINRLVKQPSFLSPGEIGCALSHLGVYKELLASQESAALIFEDDIYFTDDLTKDLLIALYDDIAQRKKPAILALQPAELFFRIDDMVGTTTILETPRFMGAYGYIINKAAANNILNIQNLISFEIDQFKLYYFLGSTNLYCASQPLVIAGDSFKSEIGNDRYTTTPQRGELRNKYFDELLHQLSLGERLYYYVRRLRKHRAKPYNTL